MRASADPAPKIAATRSNSKRPTRPQLSPPTMTSSSVTMLRAFIRVSPCRGALASRRAPGWGQDLGGSRTASITWITPLVATMSVAVTLASLTFTAAGARVDVELRAVDRLGGVVLHDVGGHQRSGHHVVGQDRGELGLVLRLEQRLDRAGRQLGEGRVRRREDGEGPRPLQRVDEPGRGEGGGEGVELAGGDRRFDDIGLGRLGRACREHAGHGRCGESRHLLDHR